jgi:FkbM family methyltransferase
MKKKLLSIDNINFHVYDLEESLTADYCQDHLNSNYYGIRDITLPDNAVVLDIGANIGGICIYLAKKFPSIKIHAIEPLQLNCENLSKAVDEQGIVNVSTYMYAIKAQSGEFKVGVDRGLSGCAKVQDREFVYQNIVKAWALPQFLDMANIEYVDLLKINVEGDEYEIFEQLSDEWLTNHIGNIVGEFHYEKAESLDHRIKRIFPNSNIRYA